jgi:hypothetical protein
VNTPFRSSAARTAATIAAAAALFLSGGVTLTGSTAADQTGGWTASGRTGTQARFVDRHGPVLHRPQLYLIYWGTGWQPQAAPDPTPTQVTGAAHTMLASVYLDGLAQYRGIGRGTVRGTTVIASDPPADFTGDRIAEFVDTQLTNGTVPGPDPDNQTVYGVVLPTRIGPGWTGEHNYYTHSGQRIHYAWFTNPGDLAWITRTISHELVESATDPEGDGIVGVTGTCDEPGWCEISDICMSTLADVDGVAVQGYWSNRDRACIVPGSGAPAAAPKRAKRPSTQRAPGMPGWEAT